jgi:type I restriction enzyme R subunit
MISKDDRAKAFRYMKSDFINSLGSGKDIVLLLLEKYRSGGVENISDPIVFRTPPFDKIGSTVGIGDLVGGPHRLKEILDQLQSGLYEEDDRR